MQAFKGRQKLLRKLQSLFQRVFATIQSVYCGEEIKEPPIKLFLIGGLFIFLMLILHAYEKVQALLAIIFNLKLQDQNKDAFLFALNLQGIRTHVNIHRQKHPD